MKSEMSDRSTTEQHVPRKTLGKTTPREQAVAVTKQGTGRIPWEKDENRECREQRIELGIDFVGRGTRHDALRLQCEALVHKLTSEVISRMWCMAKNGSGGPVHVRVGRVRRGRTRVYQRECADDHRCETSWGAVAEQMRKHASTLSSQRGQHNRDEGTDRIVGSPSCSSNGGAVERGPGMRTTRTRD